MLLVCVTQGGLDSSDSEERLKMKPKRRKVATRVSTSLPFFYLVCCCASVVQTIECCGMCVCVCQAKSPSASKKTSDHSPPKAKRSTDAPKADVSSQPTSKIDVHEPDAERVESKCLVGPAAGGTVHALLLKDLHALRAEFHAQICQMQVAMAQGFDAVLGELMKESTKNDSTRKKVVENSVLLTAIRSVQG